MTSTAVVSSPRYDARTIVRGGVLVGAVTALGVVVFALISRAMPAGAFETHVQAAIVIAGGALVTYWPASMVHPRDVDTIGWTTLLAYVGTVTFTILDIAMLRPLGMYHWTWDAIGGGSGFWYISIWWMGGTFLSWMGAWAYALESSRRTVPIMAVGTAIAAIVVYVLFNLVVGHTDSSHAALTFFIVAVLRVPVVAVMGRNR